MNKAWIGVVVVVLLLIVARVGISLTSHTSEKEQIRAALQESIDAGKEGKAGGVLQLLDKNVVVNDQSANGGLGQLSDFIKRTHPDVTFSNVDPIVNGDQAQVTSAASIDISLLGQHRKIDVDNVVLTFQKEAATEWYVIPVKKWRLVQVQAPNFSPEQLGG